MSAGTPERSVRPGSREYVRGTETSHTIADSLVYLVSESLENIRGPAFGAVELPIHLDWGPARHYDVDDDSSCRTLYQLTLQNSGSVEEIAGIINASRLVALWPSMRLPARCRQL